MLLGVLGALLDYCSTLDWILGEIRGRYIRNTQPTSAACYNTVVVYTGRPNEIKGNRCGARFGRTVGPRNLARVFPAPVRTHTWKRFR